MFFSAHDVDAIKQPAPRIVLTESNVTGSLGWDTAAKDFVHQRASKATVCWHRFPPVHYSSHAFNPHMLHYFFTLQVREHKITGPYVEDLSSHAVCDFTTIQALLLEGDKM